MFYIIGKPHFFYQIGATVLGPIGVNVRKSYRWLEILPPGRKSIQAGLKSIHPGWKSNHQTAWKSYRWLENFPPMWLEILPPWLEIHPPWLEFHSTWLEIYPPNLKKLLMLGPAYIIG